jgi:hypothetical protein
VRVLAAEPMDFAWLVGKTSCAVSGGFRAIKAIDDAGRIRGMVGYDLWTENAVTAHMAVDTPIAWRALIPECFRYPFEQCGKEIMLGVIPADNAKSWGLASHLGFRIAHTVRDGWARGVDLLLLELRRTDCRFLRRN